MPLRCQIKAWPKRYFHLLKLKFQIPNTKLVYIISKKKKRIISDFKIRFTCYTTLGRAKVM